jgi:O-antigen ligase
MNKIITQKRISYSSCIGILLLYLKLFFVEPIFSLGSIGFSFSQILLIIIFIRVLYKLILKKISIIGNNRAANIFWLYIVFSSISSILLSPEISIGVFTVNLQLFLIYLLFIDIKTDNFDEIGIKKFINSLVYFAIINTLFVYYTFFFGQIELLGEIKENDDITRAFGLMGDQFPWFISFFAIYALYRKKKYLFLFFTIGILMGASVGASIVLIVSVIFYVLKEKTLSVFFNLKAVVLVITFVLMLLVYPNVFNKIGILNRFNQGDFDGKESITLGHRLNAITTAIGKISEKPLFGYQNYSLAMFEKYDNQLLISEKGDLSYLASPNNQLLALICDYGLIGFILFLFFFNGLLKILKYKFIEMPPSIVSFKKASYQWLMVFIFFNQSATWILPGSFLWVLVCLIIAINYKINHSYGV